MKVKVIQNYTDLELKEIIVKGAELEVSKERAKVLIESGVAKEAKEGRKGNKKDKTFTEEPEVISKEETNDTSEEAE